MCIRDSRYAGDQETAQDLMHDGFLKLFDSFDKFTWRGEGSLRAWMERVMAVSYTHLDVYKRQVLVTITDEVTGRVLGEWQADFKRGTNRVTVDFVLHKPKLWWSNGLRCV